VPTFERDAGPAQEERLIGIGNRGLECIRANRARRSTNAATRKQRRSPSLSGPVNATCAVGDVVGPHVEGARSWAADEEQLKGCGCDVDHRADEGGGLARPFCRG
jgi:hypothetical protein